MKTLTITDETYDILRNCKNRTGMPLQMVMHLAAIEWERKHVPAGDGHKIILIDKKETKKCTRS